jgi:hypothetical protein
MRMAPTSVLALMVPADEGLSPARRMDYSSKRPPRYLARKRSAAA